MNYKKRLGLCMAAIMILSNAAGTMSVTAFADDGANSTVTDMVELIPATGNNSTEDTEKNPEGETTKPSENDKGETPTENEKDETTPPTENGKDEVVPPTENKDNVIPMIALQDTAKPIEAQEPAKESNGMNKEDWEYDETSKPDGIILKEYKGTSGDVMIPSQIDGKQVYITKFPGAPGLNAPNLNPNDPNPEALTDNDAKIKSVTTVSVGGGKVMPDDPRPDARPVFGIPWLSNKDNLTSVDLTHYDISGYTDLQGMFFCRKNLTTIKGLDTRDTSNITQMFRMFYGTQFTDLEQLRNWNVSNVKDITNMFSRHITDISALSGWDVSKVEKAAYLFAHCDQIQDFSPISNWELGKNASKLDLTQMFKNSSMEFIDLSKWNIKDDTTTDNMFLYKDNANPNQTKPLLVVTNSDKIKEYDFAASNRVGVQMTFKVDGQETAKSDAYITIPDTKRETIQGIWEKETVKIPVPLKKDMIFDRWEPETKINNAYEALSATYNAVFKPLNPTEPSKPDNTVKPDNSSRPNDTTRPEESYRPNDTTKPEESSKPEGSIKLNKKKKPQEVEKTDKTEDSAVQTEAIVPDTASKPNPDTGDMGTLTMLSAMLAASSGTFAVLLGKKNHKK